MIKFSLQFFAFLALISGLNSPDHCYDFVSTTVTDSCGSVDFTVHCRPYLIVIANSGSPHCDNSGCSFTDGASHFLSSVPSGMG